jgi:hypothetical protein
MCSRINRTGTQRDSYRTTSKVNPHTGGAGIQNPRY